MICTDAGLPEPSVGSSEPAIEKRRRPAAYDNITLAGVPAANCGGTTPTGTWTTIATGDPPTKSAVFDTTGLAGSTIGFRGHYVPQGSGYAESASPGVDLTITASCNGATIAADQTGGPNPVTAGDNATWTFQIKVHACEDLTNVSAQAEPTAGLPSQATRQARARLGSGTTRRTKC